MKTFAIALVALLVAASAIPVALAQDNQQAPASQSQAPAAQPQQPASSPDVKAPAASGGVDAKGSMSGEVKTRTERTEDSAGAASPRTTTEITRTSFFGLSSTAAIIVSVAVLLVVILAIVAMTNNRGTTYIDRDPRGL